MNFDRYVLISLSAFFMAFLSYKLIDYPLALTLANLPKPLIFIFTLMSAAIAPFPHLILWSFLYFISLFRSSLEKYRSFFLEIAMTVGFTMFAIGLLKMGIGRPRPALYLQTGELLCRHWTSESGYLSFPSSHAAAALILYFHLSLSRPHLASRVLVIALLLSISRIFLLRHFLSDVIIGGILGITLAIVVHALYSKTKPFLQKYLARFV